MNLDRSYTDKNWNTVEKLDYSSCHRYILWTTVGSARVRLKYHFSPLNAFLDESIHFRLMFMIYEFKSKEETNVNFQSVNSLPVNACERIGLENTSLIKRKCKI